MEIGPYVVGILFLAILNVAHAQMNSGAEVVVDRFIILKNRAADCGGSGNRSSVYYVNHSPTEWDAANIKCRRDLGGSLIAFDDPNEQDCLDLDNQDGGDTYWTSGMYSTDFCSWNWFINENNMLKPIHDDNGKVGDIPWADGHPISSPNSLLRIAYTRIDLFTSYLTTVPKGNLLKAICEVKLNQM